MPASPDAIASRRSGRRRRSFALSAKTFSRFSCCLFALLIFGELLGFAQCVVLFLAQSCKFDLGCFGTLTGRDQLRVFDLCTRCDQPAAFGFSCLPFCPGALLGLHPSLFGLGLPPFFAFAYIRCVAHGTTDGGSGGSTDSGAGSCFTRLVADNATEDGSGHGSGRDARLGVFTGGLAT